MPEEEKVGLVYDGNQLVADESDEIFVMIADCHGRNCASGVRSSRSFMTMMMKQTFQPFVAFDLASHSADFIARLAARVSQALVIPFSVVIVRRIG